MNKIKISKKNRIPWLNFASSYINAAQAISEKIDRPVETEREKTTNCVMIIPLLFLLRHSLELSLKSIFISYGIAFEKEHNLETLLDESQKYLEFDREDKESLWNEVREIVKGFSKAVYSGKKIFFDEDPGSFALRYLQPDEKGNYVELRNIDHQELVKKVKRVRSLCEVLTLKTAINVSWED